MVGSKNTTTKSNYTAAETSLNISETIKRLISVGHIKISGSHVLEALLQCRKPAFDLSDVACLEDRSKVHACPAAKLKDITAVA